MIKKALLILITLASIQYPYYSQEIIIEEGDTLSEIAKRYQITVRSIMDHNQIYNGDKLKVGSRISLPININKDISTSTIEYKVMPGDTLEKIADLYSIDKNDIININSIKEPDILTVNQILFLPKDAKLKTSITTKIPKIHILKEGETIYQVSNKYNISADHIININNIQDPSLVRAGYKLKLIKHNKLNASNEENINSRLARVDDNSQKNYESQRDSNGSELRYFGPLKIRWSSWRHINGSYITPAEHENGRSLFLAVNCQSSKINLSKRNGNWSKWLEPKKYFEYNLLDERCGNAS